MVLFITQILYSIFQWHVLLNPLTISLPMFPPQVEFEGISGHIAFDQNGLRKDFTLDVYNVALTRGTAKVFCLEKIYRISCLQT